MTGTRTPADLVLTNGTIYTAERHRRWASAMAIRDGRLVAVGSDDDVAAFADGATQKVDLAGSFVLPGLVDVHNHHAVAGRAELYELTFSAAAGYRQILAAVDSYARHTAPDGWIVGGSWGSTLIGRLADPQARRDLDEAAGGRPVILVDDSHHNRWVSTSALELAGITDATPDPAGGVIVRDPSTGAASGLMLEAAGPFVERAVRSSRSLSPEQHERCSERGVEIAHSYGITAFQDAAISLETMQALKALDDAGRLDAWVVSSMAINDQIFGYTEVGDALIARGEETRSERHRPDFVKIFLDGTPPAHTGAFLGPYLPTDERGADYCGTTIMTADELLGWLRKAAELGLSAKVHCSGDASVRMVLDAVAAVRDEGFTDVRYQIAHGQFISPDDVPRLAELDVAADISPFLWFPGEIADALARVRPSDQIRRIQPNRTLIDAGALVAGGSDWPVSETPNAWEGIHGLVTRSDPAGARAGQLAPDQAITLEEAIAVFTINAAEAMGLGDATGSLRTGKSADFVVLDRNPFDLPADQLVRTNVRSTWFAGRKVFEREG